MTTNATLLRKVGSDIGWPLAHDSNRFPVRRGNGATGRTCGGGAPQRNGRPGNVLTQTGLAGFVFGRPARGARADVIDQLLLEYDGPTPRF